MRLSVWLLRHYPQSNLVWTSTILDGKEGKYGLQIGELISFRPYHWDSSRVVVLYHIDPHGFCVVSASFHAGDLVSTPKTLWCHKRSYVSEQRLASCNCGFLTGAGAPKTNFDLFFAWFSNLKTTPLVIEHGWKIPHFPGGFFPLAPRHWRHRHGTAQWGRGGRHSATQSRCQLDCYDRFV